MIRFDDVDNDDNDDKKWHCYCNLDNYDDENDDLLLVLLNFCLPVHLCLAIITLLDFYSIYNALCRPSDCTVGTPRAEIRKLNLWRTLYYFVLARRHCHRPGAFCYETPGQAGTKGVEEENIIGKNVGGHRAEEKTQRRSLARRGETTCYNKVRQFVFASLGLKSLQHVKVKFLGGLDSDLYSERLQRKD